MTDIYLTNFGNHVKGYKPYNDYLKFADLEIFKNHKDFNYMTEHLGETQKKFGMFFFNLIMDLKMINIDFFISLINMNDKIGKPTTYEINNAIPKCSPNTLKYIYFGLLNIKHIQTNNLNNFDFIEIGGGYGGQCVILLKLFEHFKINISKYILIDIQDVVKFQKKYVDYLIPDNNSIDLSFSIKNLIEYEFSQNSYMFSSYSFSEIQPEIRNIYYTHLFTFIKHGLIIWPCFEVDLPKSIKYIKKKTSLPTPKNLDNASVGEFIYF